MTDDSEDHDGEAVMIERDVQRERGTRRLPAWELAAYGAGSFVSGLFVLAAVGTRFEPAVYAWILILSVIVALPVAGAGVLLAVAERASGRAWLSGGRVLEPAERPWVPTVMRGVRYASWVWLANGAALWLATVVARFG